MDEIPANQTGNIPRSGLSRLAAPIRRARLSRISVNIHLLIIEVFKSTQNYSVRYVCPPETRHQRRSTVTDTSQTPRSASTLFSVMLIYNFSRLSNFGTQHSGHQNLYLPLNTSEDTKCDRTSDHRMKISRRPQSDSHSGDGGVFSSRKAR